MTSFFSLTMALSAFLLFSIQFLMARLLLPEFGGAPALWLSSIVFFQGLLCLSYCYAHALRTLFSLKKQLIVHSLCLLASAACLPVSESSAHSWGFADPSLQVMLILLLSCGASFFVLGATSGLIQHWQSLLKPDGDPYWLYAASNGGSVVALVLEPLVLDRFLSLEQRATLWSGAFILCMCCLFLAMIWTAFKVKPKAPIESLETKTGIGWKQRGRWFLWSSIPAFLLYGLTVQLTSDLASVPLLWTIPLLLYLLSFILAFSQLEWGSLEGAARKTAPISLVFVLLLALPNLPIPKVYLGVILTFQCVAVGIAMALIHKDLAYDRPDPSSLTEYYFVLSLGGFFGGVLCSLLAPLLFPSLLEYPLGLVFAILVLWQAEGDGTLKKRAQLMVLSMILGLLLFCWSGAIFLNNWAFVLVGCALLGALTWSAEFLSRGSAFFSLLLLLGIGAFAPGPMAGIQESQRSFFGLHRILTEKSSQTVVLLHGNTVHGRQSLDPEKHGEALAYYHKSGPAGQVFSNLKGREDIAVFGLGVGSLAAYSRSGQRWIFFEIDPKVIGIAKDTRYFHFLEKAQGELEIKLGDARLEFSRLPEKQAFDLIALDVFSSGSVPAHLLTREAFEIYLNHLKKGGLLLLHISNQHLDLEALVAVQAASLGLDILAQKEMTLADADRQRGCTRSHWVILGREKNCLGNFRKDKRWREVKPSPDLRPWTDDHSDILSIYRFGR
ncbi:MAG: fused MFS/spermidine synthase [Planctomycetota bacterium]|nr:fused MFS/spermidine synthase [Planctomycetota bacterium]